MRKNIKSFLLPLILASMVDDPYRVRRIHINNHPKPVKRDEKKQDREGVRYQWKENNGLFKKGCH